ncbi:hypothetical protein KP78_04660 [Jeotgalibacillus soli]|uniref:Uncharacterized protein n=1 Tax=Jeotgalibacillus soli TaxID=889306 RepID=A0A0C2W698_9BACL|nr:hypothetical protein KP78_04660 [Jeotgalibacillus soli]
MRKKNRMFCRNRPSCSPKSSICVGGIGLFLTGIFLIVMEWMRIAG